MAGSFKDLEIWKTGYQLLMEIYDLTAKYPSQERFGLSSQTQNSANGIIANIAEAHGRYYFADKIRVLYISRGECSETQSHLAVAYGRKYITKEEFKRLDSEYRRLGKKINNFIRSIANKNKTN